MTTNKTWTDVKKEMTSPIYWWHVCLFLATITAIAAINKWVVHLPGFYKW